MVSVIGNTFKLTKANVTHDTDVGDVVVVCGYERNDAKDRMEAALAVFRTEEEAAAVIGGVKALAVDTSALAVDEKATHDAAMAKNKKLLKGLGHGSLSSIMGADNWRGVFNVAVPMPVPPDAVPAGVAAERAALEVLRFDAAKLPYRDGHGVTKVGIITDGVVESIQWGAGVSITGNEVVRFTFMVGSEPSEECCTLTDLKHGIAAGIIGTNVVWCPPALQLRSGPCTAVSHSQYLVTALCALKHCTYKHVRRTRRESQPNSWLVRRVVSHMSRSNVDRRAHTRHTRHGMHMQRMWG